MEQIAEELFPAVTVEQGGVAGGLEGQEQADGEEDQRGQPDPEKHVQIAIFGHALRHGGDDVVDNKEEHGDDHGKSQPTLADDGAQGGSDKEENQTGKAQGELLVPFLAVAFDVELLRIEVLLVERDVLLGIFGVGGRRLGVLCRASRRAGHRLRVVGARVIGDLAPSR